MPKYVAIENKITSVVLYKPETKMVTENEQQVEKAIPPYYVQKNKSNEYLYKDKLSYLANDAPSLNIRHLANDVINANAMTGYKLEAYIAKEAAIKDKIKKPLPNVQFFSMGPVALVEQVKIALPDASDYANGPGNLDRMGYIKHNIIAVRHNNRATFWGRIKNAYRYGVTYLASMNFLNPKMQEAAALVRSYMDEYDQYMEDVHAAYINMQIAKADLYRAEVNQKRAERALGNAVNEMAEKPNNALNINQAMILATLGNKTTDVRYAPHNIILKAAVQGALEDKPIDVLLDALALPPLSNEQASAFKDDNEKHCYQLALAIGNQDPETGYKLLAKAGIKVPSFTERVSVTGVINSTQPFAVQANHYLNATTKEANKVKEQEQKQKQPQQTVQEQEQQQQTVQEQQQQTVQEQQQQSVQEQEQQQQTVQVEQHQQEQERNQELMQEVKIVLYNALKKDTQQNDYPIGNYHDYCSNKVSSSELSQEAKSFYEKNSNELDKYVEDAHKEIQANKRQSNKYIYESEIQNRINEKITESIKTDPGFTTQYYLENAYNGIHEEFKEKYGTIEKVNVEGYDINQRQFMSKEEFDKKYSMGSFYQGANELVNKLKQEKNQEQPFDTTSTTGTKHTNLNLSRMATVKSSGLNLDVNKIHDESKQLLNRGINKSDLNKTQQPSTNQGMSDNNQGLNNKDSTTAATLKK